MDTEIVAPINETLKTGPDNANKNGKGHGVKTMVLNKRNTKRRSNKVTAKIPSTHAVMDIENEAPINETLKTGPDNANENGKGHEVETMELNKKRNTK